MPASALKVFLMRFTDALAEVGMAAQPISVYNRGKGRGLELHSVECTQRR